MKVLSLFDGMSCGQIALNKLGVSVDTYYASEIDKYAIEITQKNYPGTVQVGDITKLKAEDFKDVDLILAGSPCQGFSFAGKQLAFDDPRSALFFEFIRLLKEIKPKYFLLENVRMKKEFIDVISEQVSKCYPEILFGIEPTLINSSLLSAQSRQRLYWTNIQGVTQPKDKNIVLKDILETDGETDLVINNGSEAKKQNIEKGTTLLARDYKGWNTYGMTGVREKPQQVGTAVDINGHDILKRVYSPEGKAPTLNTMGGGNREPKVVVQSYREVRTKEAKQLRKKIRKETGKDFTPFRAKELVEREDGKVGTITPALNNDHKISLTRDKNQEVYWRRLTPLECERLQTVPDNYTEGVSKTQRLKMLGNGWTVDVIAHILKNM